MDVVHISPEDMKEFEDYKRYGEFIRVTLEENIEITMLLDVGYRVTKTVGDTTLSGEGSTLVTAVGSLIATSRRVVSPSFQGAFTQMNQYECPHDIGSYTKDNPLVHYCSACHAQVPGDVSLL